MTGLLLFLITSLLAACSGGSSAQVENQRTIVRNLEDIPPEFVAVIDNLASIQTVRVDVTTEMAGLPPQTGQLEFSAPFAFRAKSDAGSGSYGWEFVMLNLDYFLRIGPNWFPRTLPDLTSEPLALVTPLAAGQEYPVEIIRTGTASVGERRCDSYTLLPGPGAPPLPGPRGDLASGVSIQLCIANSRIVRSIVNAGGVTVTGIFHYDLPVDIRAP